MSFGTIQQAVNLLHPESENMPRRRGTHAKGTKGICGWKRVSSARVTPCTTSRS